MVNPELSLLGSLKSKYTATENTVTMHSDDGGSSSGNAGEEENYNNPITMTASSIDYGSRDISDDDIDSIVGSEIYVESEMGSAAAHVPAPPTEEKAESIAPNEHRLVRRMRILVHIGIILISSILSAFLYLSASNAESNDFKVAFHDDADMLIFGIQNHAERHIEAIDSLAVSITSYTSSIGLIAGGDDNSNNSWPLVAIPDFQKRATSLHRLAGVQSVTLSPLITSEDERISWEMYTAENNFVKEDNLFGELSQEQQQKDSRMINKEANRIYRIDNDGNFVVEDNPPPYLPVWQMSPVHKEQLVNYNLASDPRIGSAVTAALQTQTATMTKTIIYQNETEFIFSPVNQTGSSPVHIILYPLFDGFQSTGKHLVGLLATVSSWTSYLKDIFPPSTDVDMIVVIDNTCGQLLSYGIHKDKIEYLGEGDYHESVYDSFAVTTPLLQTRQSPTLEDDTLNVSLSSCDYLIRVYPTLEMETRYKSIRPVAYLVAAAAAGLFVLIGFMMYDCSVARRHNVVVLVAIRSRGIVTSLFPTVVHDRLFQQESPSATQLENGSENDMPQQKRKSSPAIMDNSSDLVDQECAREHRDIILNKQISVKSTISNDRLIDRNSRSSISSRGELPKLRLRSFLAEAPISSDGSIRPEDKPIADLFPNTTVMFADIAGFTAWSSAREPAQVFTLLETIYCTFDSIAKKRNVFKVETIGDCYVAVTGLPEPQEEHAIIMAKFAKECMIKMKELTRKLEASLGPQTGELSMRFGLHSGPVTAGVLRGEKSRFQLFGDTVNTASRMESTGQRNRIQASQSTADLLLAAGKENWVHARDDIINAKGKGSIQTYWITPRSSLSGVGSSHCSLDDGASSAFSLDGDVKLLTKRKTSQSMRRSSHHSRELDMSEHKKPISRRDFLVEAASRRGNFITVVQKKSDNDLWGNSLDNIDIHDSANAFDTNDYERLIDWNIEILTTLLKQIVGNRMAKTMENSASNNTSFSSMNSFASEEAVEIEKGTVFEEITEIIDLPNYNPDDLGGTSHIDYSDVELNADVEAQLREYVTMLACMYRDNFFHNFEHASHVTMSAQKLLKRVIVAEQERESMREESSMGEGKAALSDSLHDYTYGITSDPLTQFAIVFSALIHDVDHTGVPNTQLVKEKAHIANLYKNKSVAEQNSLDLAWELLMEPSYKALQDCIFADASELKRFRQLIVNVVLATDIFDKDMMAIRNSRFGKAFGKEPLATPLTERDDRNLKTTIVIEYIMQASDVSHTMQHWEIFTQWNERLFDEMFTAYNVNRADKDPSEGWYKGELWFFDNYIIPLAKKLKDCGVFGAASHECLNYALKNRKEWEARGEEMVEKYKAKHNQ